MARCGGCDNCNNDGVNILDYEKRFLLISVHDDFGMRSTIIDGTDPETIYASNPLFNPDNIALRNEIDRLTKWMRKAEIGNVSCTHANRYAIRVGDRSEIQLL